MKIINPQKIDELQLPFTFLAGKELGEIAQRNRPFLVNKTQLAILLQPVFHKFFPSPLCGHQSCGCKPNSTQPLRHGGDILDLPINEKFPQINQELQFVVPNFKLP